MKVLSFKVRSDSLSVRTEVNHQSEAGARAQPELNQIGTLALMGDTMVNVK